MIKKWNRKVGKDDLVFHLGDFAIRIRKNILKLKGMLNGTIMIIAGNHDRKKVLKMSGFIVLPSNIIKLGTIVLTHIPLKYVHSGVVNVHGHIHNGKSHGERVNACVDVTKFEPINIAKYFGMARGMLI